MHSAYGQTPIPVNGASFTRCQQGLDCHLLTSLLPGSRGSPQNKGILSALSEVVADAGHSHAQARATRLLQHKGLLDAGSAASAQAWETYIPQKVRLAIQGRFERLSAACRDALGAASIRGREFESSLLREITGEESPDIEAFLKEALTHGLIEEIIEKPAQYRFTHALIQVVVREQIPGPRRSALHLRIGEALERHLGQDVEARAGELARHFDAAGQENSGKAFEYYRLAGERALRLYGFEDAFEQLSRALDLGKGKCSPLDTARLLFGLAQSQHGLGKFNDAVETHAQAFDLFIQNGEIDNAVHIFEQPLILTEKPANLTKLLERFERAISLPGPGSLRGEALGGLYGLTVYHDTGDYERAVSIFERALQSARKSGNRQQETYALSDWGLIESDELHFERACQMEEEAIRLALESGDLWIEAVCRAIICVALLGLGRIVEAEKQSRLLLALADRLQTRLWTAISSITSASVHRQRGELRAAREVTDMALALADPSYLVINRASRVLLDYETGEPAHAAELLQKVEVEADRAVLPFHWEGLLALLIPYAAWVTGEPLPLAVAEAAALKVPVVGGLRRGDAVTVSVGRGLIAAIRNDRESAARHYQALLPFRGLVVSPYQGLAADHILALLASTSGDAPRAREHFDSALVFCRANGLVLELAYTCRDYAEFLLHTAAKTEAQKILDLCRARPARLRSTRVLSI